MKLVALLSGGKDSMFNMLQCIAAGHDVVAVANIEPETKEELDSYMYQSVGHQAVSLIAITLGLPIYRQKTKGKAVCKNKTYTETIQDEVEDMVQLLQKVKRDIHIEGVSVGAIASDYQRTRVENVCTRLGLKCFAYLWRRDQIELLQEMIDADLDAIVIKVASIGLNDVHLGLHIRDIKDHLIDIHKKYGVNVCGEGGEYETLTTDCPLFQRKITITEYENVILSNDAFAPVAFLDVKNAILKPKVWGTDDPIISLQTRLAYVKSVVKDPYKYIEDCIDEIFPQNKAVSTSDILPFPFESKPNLGKTSGSVGTYWKSSSTTSQHPHPSHKVTISSSETSACDTSSSNLNYSSGWCCIGNVTGKNFAEALGYLQRHFETSGYEARDVVLVNLYLRDMREFSVVNKIYSQHMPEVMPPARVCVGVPFPPEVNILIVVLAHKSVSKSQKVITAGCEPMREVMHVQSISHWAPANIGPYSQCVRVGGLYYLAGQIPLIPGTMEILNKPIVHQCKLTLRHVSRVLEAMDDSLDFSNVFQAICYVTSEEVAYDVPHLWSYVTKNETAVVAVLVVSALPKNAQMEWEVVACSYDRPQVHECVDVINEFSVRLKRCIYSEPYTSSIVCNVVPVKKSEFTRKQRELTPETLKIILKYCLQFIKKEVKNIGSHMCMLKLFYKHNYYKLGETVVAGLRTVEFDHKVVTSGIPVLACSEPEVIMTITGMCH